MGTAASRSTTQGADSAASESRVKTVSGWAPPGDSANDLRSLADIWTFDVSAGREQKPAGRRGPRARSKDQEPAAPRLLFGCLMRPGIVAEPHDDALRPKDSAATRNSQVSAALLLRRERAHSSFNLGSVFCHSGSQGHALTLPMVTDACPMEMRTSEWSLHRFTVLKALSVSEHSKVYLTSDIYSGLQVAIKVVDYSTLDDAGKVNLEREIRLHSALKHPNVLAMYGAFRVDHFLLILQEVAHKDLSSVLEGMPLDESVIVRRVLFPLLLALEYVHGVGIIHRDIKLENVAFSATGQLKLMNFGFCIDAVGERPVSRLGTLEYMAPELVWPGDLAEEEPEERGAPGSHDRDNFDESKGNLHTRQYRTSVDIWALGVVLYELLVRRKPFERESRGELARAIMAGECTIPPWLGAHARAFLSACLSVEPSQRPTASALLTCGLMSAHLERDHLEVAAHTNGAHRGRRHSVFSVVGDRMVEVRGHNSVTTPLSSRRPSRDSSRPVVGRIGSSARISGALGAGFPACAAAPATDGVLGPGRDSKAHTRSVKTQSLTGERRLSAEAQRQTSFMDDTCASALMALQDRYLHTIASADAAMMQAQRVIWQQQRVIQQPQGR
ncbi:unnamed protein product [Pedinophyceae sp. YPF-701]|nr:unnamed protein product [Pedinophyceae sp. YPF-701]